MHFPGTESFTRLISAVVFSAALAATATLRSQVVALDFENAGDRLAQTGSAGVTFTEENGSIAYVAGVNGGTGADFDGSVFLQADSSPLVSALTVTFWMKTTTADGNTLGDPWYAGAGLVDGELGGETDDWGLSLIGDRVAFGIGAPDTTLYSAQSVTTGNWVFVAATWETTGEMKLYVDGVLSATDYGSTNDRISATGNPFSIGLDPNGGQYIGALDQIALYDTALSSGQIAAMYAAVPEPATYAVVGGLLALGAVIYRRRPAGGS